MAQQVCVKDTEENNMSARRAQPRSASPSRAAPRAYRPLPPHLAHTSAGYGSEVYEHFTANRSLSQRAPCPRMYDPRRTASTCAAYGLPRAYTPSEGYAPRAYNPESYAPRTYRPTAATGSNIYGPRSLAQTSLKVSDVQKYMPWPRAETFSNGGTYGAMGYDVAKNAGLAALDVGALGLAGYTARTAWESM